MWLKDEAEGMNGRIKEEEVGCLTGADYTGTYCNDSGPQGK